MSFFFSFVIHWFWCCFQIPTFAVISFCFPFAVYLAARYAANSPNWWMKRRADNYSIAMIRQLLKTKPKKKNRRETNTHKKHQQFFPSVFYGSESSLVAQNFALTKRRHYAETKLAVGCAIPSSTSIVCLQNIFSKLQTESEPKKNTYAHTQLKKKKKAKEKRTTTTKNCIYSYYYSTQENRSILKCVSLVAFLFFSSLHSFSFFHWANDFCVYSLQHFKSKWSASALFRKSF